jgi:hypothetical protein
MLADELPSKPVPTPPAPLRHDLMWNTLICRDPGMARNRQLPSRVLLGCVVERAVADVARAGHDDEQALQ